MKRPVWSCLLSLGVLLAGCAAAPGEPYPLVILVPVESAPAHPLPHRPPIGTDALVCGVGQQACRGAYGARCYTPGKGERCTEGMVCPAGQQACVRGRTAQCYTPSRGESCH
jgi:hypothetical protein